ncbi:MAG: hypothetical protein MUO72_05650 [Bacteroidales bacterium]|nr:hypothetical protein [Bacteroidales bacterium]
MKKVFTIFFFLNLIPSCKKEEVKFLISDQVTTNQYYSTEIFSETNQKIYGKWRFLCISGGLYPSFHDPTYDYLEIVRIGIYGIIKDNSIEVIGKIIVEKQDDKGLRVVFSPDDKYQNHSQPTTRDVILRWQDSLALSDGFMDGYSSYYVRVK